ncbi:bifunctional proline dehydrogenase/L-glutamate gamma-semialdehyde dehydrogenase, partial [bacterium]|nr:bifunctional proline dehydrogenase/L-glutamate gamma-semialdehyde dehydrogenase [bacterium]
MSTPKVEDAILARGREFFEHIGNETPSVFNKNWWTGKVMDFAMSNERFKVQLFRFIDVLPTLTTEESLARHIREYFGQDDGVPTVLRWGFKAAGLGGRLAMRMLGKTIRSNLERMARDFIVGADPRESVKTLGKLRKRGFAFTLDALGEATITEREADEYAANYLGLLDALGAAQDKWPALGGGDGLDWGDAPKINVSLKPSALYSQANPVDFAGSVEGMLARLKLIARKVVALGGSLCVDIEMRKLKNITFELFRRLRSDPEFRDYPYLGVAVQTYLKEADDDIDGLLAWARRESLPISIRLVKGAYWDYETAMAAQNEWPVPVYTVKEHTDAAFERNAEKILRNHDICHLACGSHNVRSVSAILETARALGVPQGRYEFQVLYGMAEPFRKALLRMTDRVRLYCPHGDMLPGMAYLIRRLLENTSNESFLKQTFVDSVEMDRLLAAPRADAPETVPVPSEDFKNEPSPDWARSDVREQYAQAIADVRGKLGNTYPLFIGGEDVTTEDVAESVNPARPEEVVGAVCQAGPAEADRAIAAARDAFPAWRDTAAAERAGILMGAAELARERIHTLSAWMTLEGGKQWSQAYLDAAEAVDFLDYYAAEIVRLSAPRRMGHAPGEANTTFYQPKGVAAVIAPWNFPLAISCGMCAAALAAGNTVVYKPSRLTPVVGHT